MRRPAFLMCPGQRLPAEGWQFRPLAGDIWTSIGGGQSFLGRVSTLPPTPCQMLPQPCPHPRVSLGPASSIRLTH